MTLAAGLLAGFSAKAEAATRTASVTGSWSQTATWGGAAVPTAADDVIINNGVTVTMNGNTGSALSLTINGTANWAQVRTTNIGTGGIMINSGGNITGAAAGILTTTGNLTINANTTSTTVVVTMQTTAGHTISGTGSLGRLAVNSTTTNNGTLTVTTVLSGSSALTNAAGATLSIGGTSTITTLTATAAGNTVTYNGVAQTVKATPYSNLTLSGSGAKTFPAGTTTVNGILSMEGTATTTLTGTLAYGAAATLQYNRPTALTAGGEWMTPFAASGGIIIANSGVITMNSAEVVNAPLTINGGATFATNNFGLTFGGDFSNNGAFTAGSSPITISGTGTQNIARFTTTGALTCTKTGGTANLQGNVSATSLTLNGTSGTLNLGSSTHNINGNLIITAGTLDIASSTFTVAGTTSVTGTLTHSSALGTKQYTGLVTINPGGIWNNSGNSAINFRGGLTNNGTFTAGTGVYSFNTNNQAVGGAATSIPNLTVATPAVLTNNITTGGLTVGAALSGTGGLTQSASAILNIGGTSAITTLTATANPNTVNYNGSAFQTVKGTTYNILKINNSAGATLGGAATVTALTIGDITGNSMFDDGGFGVSSAGTLNLTSGTIKVGVAYPAFATNTISAGTTVEYNGGGAQTVSSAPNYQNLAFSGAGTKTLGGAITVNGNMNIASGTLDAGAGNFALNVKGNWTNSGTFNPRSGTVTFNGLGAQTINNGNTWYGLAITGSAARTVSFQSGVAQTIAANGFLSFAGAAGQLLTLAPLTGGSAWLLNFNGATQNISYASVSYSNAGGGAIITANATNVNGGNNINWQFATTTAVAADLNPSTYGQSATFSATVTGFGSTPSGNVQFKIDGADLGGPLALSGGVVSKATSTLKAGGHIVTADYLGDSAYSASTGTLGGGQTVNKAALTITAQTNTKPYDGTLISATTPTVSGLQGNDTVTGLAEAYTDKSVGTGKTLTVTAYTVNDGNSGSNYAVTTVNDITGTIAFKALTVTGITANDKLYDGNASATLNTGAAALTGVVPPDDAALNTTSAAGSFNDANVGSGKTVTVNGLSVFGADSGNYLLTQPTVTASITNTNPVFSATSPPSDSYRNTTTVGYTFDKLVTNGTGTITFTLTGGSEDPGSPHYYHLTAPDLTAGSHTINTNLSLVNGSIYTVSFDVTDDQGYAATTVNNTNILYDATAASATLEGPAASSSVNSATVRYTLSKEVATGTIRFTQTGGIGADPLSPQIYSFLASDITGTSHTVNTGLSLLDGAIYTVSIENIVDLEGNPSASVSNTSVRYDITAVSFTGTSPSAGSATATAIVTYTLSEQALAGKITFTKTAGPDPLSSHIFNLTGSDLDAGTHTVNTTLPLADGTIYNISFDATDQAGNPATTVSNAGITFDPTAPLDGTFTGAPGNMQNVLTWSGFTDAASGINSYTLVSSPTTTPADCSGTPLYTAGTGTTYIHTALTNGVTYYYRVCATDRAGNTSAGATAQAVPRPDSYNVIATAGPNGSISCEPASVTYNLSSVCTVTANAYYHVSDVMVDGSSVGAVTSYTFNTVTADHTIAASFAIDTRTILASAGANGSISPSGAVSVNYGASQGFLVTPDAGYQLISMVTGSGCAGVYSGMTYTAGPITVDCTLTASFGLVSEGFETGNLNALPWVTGGSGNWFVQGADRQGGSFASQSGLTADNQTSYLEVSLNITSPGYVYFWLKTSTEPSWDVLRFKVDGNTNYGKWNGWSGNTDWMLVKSSLPVTTGIHTFRWEYAKDPSGSGGSDSVWIDNISFPSYGLAAHMVTPSAGAGGSISPAVQASVYHGLTTAFTVTADANYHIAGVTGCGGALSSNTYTTGPITGDCTVTASFAGNSNTITASADLHGSISPSGAISVNYGVSQGFTITPNAQYHVADVLVDGLSVGAVTSYTFTNVIAAHTIAATMAADPLVPPVFSSTSPATGSYVNTDAIGYTLNRLISDGTGTIAFTWTSGNADGNSPHTYTLTTADMTAGSHNISSGWSSGSGGLVNGAIYTVTFDLTDGGLYSASTVTNTDILYDAYAASVTLSSPAGNSIVNNSTAGYTLSKTVAFGTIVYIRTGGAVDGSSPHTYTLSAGERAAGSHSVDTGFALADGTVYSVSIENVLDLEGNSSAVVNNINVRYDATAVAFTSTSPLASSATATATVAYTLSEQVLAGKVTFTRTGGAPDAGSPQVYTMAGTDLTAGPHTVNMNLGLVDGTIYTISFDATDLAGNHATTVSNAGIVFDQTGPLDGTVTAAPGNTQTVLSWSGYTDAASGINSYTLVSSPTATPANCGGTPLFTGGGMTYTHTGLTNGVMYYYRVCATDNAGNISAGATAQAIPKPDAYNVTVNAGPNGSISCSPSSVAYNGSSECAIAPSTGYHVVDVSVGPTSGTLSSVGVVATYTINNIVANTSIAATFAVNTYEVITAPGPNGNIACSPTTVNYNSGSSCTITPNGGYAVADVTVGPTGGTLSTVGAVTAYTIRNIAANMTIAATFVVGTPPNASFTWTTDPALDYKVFYNATSSTCPSGVTCTYSWSTSETGVTASHTFADTTTTNVTLTVISSTGLSSSVLKAVTPKYMASTPTSLGAGLTVTPGGFSPAVNWTVTGGVAPYQVRVNWGDGTTTPVTQPAAGPGSLIYTFVTARTYTVSVYAIDSGVNGSNMTSATATTTVVIAPSTITVSGKVTQSNGTTPVSSVAMTLKQGTVVKKLAYTDASGNYTMTSVTAGTYTMTATKSGYTFPAPVAVDATSGSQTVNISSTTP